MKIALLCILSLLSACETLQFNSEGAVVIKAKVLNPRLTYHVGDSVAFLFQIPDTVMLNGVATLIKGNANDDGSLSFRSNKINAAATGGADAYTKDCPLFAYPGSIVNNGSFHFALVNGRFLGKMYMIPQKKGVYFLEQVNDGYAIVNNGSLRLRLTFNFGPVDRHHQLLVDSAGKASRFNEYLQDHIDRNLEIYGFRVD